MRRNRHDELAFVTKFGSGIRLFARNRCKMLAMDVDTAGRLTLKTWLGFLVGNRAAIMSVAGCRKSLWVGVLFVLSAGLAREYDGAYLLREPWHLVLPLAASIATSSLLFGLVYINKCRHGLEELSWRRDYPTLLTFFWMTSNAFTT